MTARLRRISARVRAAIIVAVVDVVFAKSRALEGGAERIPLKRNAINIIPKKKKKKLRIFVASG